MQTDFLSTTKLLKMAHETANGQIGEAIEVLRSMRFDHANALSAVRVLLTKVKKHPGSTTFSFLANGFVRVA